MTDKQYTLFDLMVYERAKIKADKEKRDLRGYEPDENSKISIRSLQDAHYMLMAESR